MNIFFIGIAGAGMASLARYIQDSGECVSGSDPYASPEALAYWRGRGCVVYDHHDASHVKDVDLVVYSAAIPKNNVERMAGEARGIAISRGEALARFANAHGGSIAVCGTHGKGTTAGAITHIFEKAGIAAGDILGAVPRGRLSSSRYVENAQYLVCEVDESDKTHLFHRPSVLLLNNVEVDHLNTYRDLNDIVDTFCDHIKTCRDTRVFVHYAGIGAPRLFDQLKDQPHVTWIAPDQTVEAEWLYRVVSVDASSRCTIELKHKDQRYQLQCGLCGHANAQNLVSAAVVALELGVSPQIVCEAASIYAGLRDRCEVTKAGDYTLVTDYASHPTCVTNDISWNRTQASRIVAVYHPYRYSLMSHHWLALANALSAADVVLLAPFDGAGEQPVEGLSSEDLAKRIQSKCPNCQAVAFASFEALERDAVQYIHPHDRLIVFGGGQLFTMGHRILNKLTSI